MQTIVSIKKDMEFNRSLGTLLEVLKNIAVSQYRALEQRLRSFERLLETIESFFELIDTARIHHPFLTPEDKPQAVVAITSDTGLLGGLNMQVIGYALHELEEIPGKLIVIGERGKMYARESKIPFVAFTGIRDEERYFQAMQLRDYLVGKVIEGTFGHLKVVYPRPLSFTVQRVEVLSVLPFLPSAQHRFQTTQASADIIVESDIRDILGYMVYLWIGQKLYEIFGLSRLAEFAARFVHLEGSSQRLKEMDNKLRLQYFRVRHELIDRNMRELFSARLMYAD